MGPFELLRGESIEIESCGGNIYVSLIRGDKTADKAMTLGHSHTLMVFTNDEWAHLTGYDLADRLDDAVAAHRRRGND